MEYCDLNEEAEQRLEYFKEQLRQRGASANTINTYARSLWLYESLYGNLSLESLNDYRNYLISHYKPSTANSRIYGMNQYLKLLESEGAEIPAGYRLASVKLQHRPFLDNVISQRDYERLKRGLGRTMTYSGILWFIFWGARARGSASCSRSRQDISAWGIWTCTQRAERSAGFIFPETLCRDALDWLETRGLRPALCLPTETALRLPPAGSAGS